MTAARDNTDTDHALEDANELSVDRLFCESLPDPSLKIFRVKVVQD
jgi:hypothetical protein